MEFIWDDGGRSDCGYVGLAGDCVTRAIAIATGTSYRDVYRALGEVSEMTPRNGVYSRFAAEYLQSLGWVHSPGRQRELLPDWLPKGVVIVELDSTCWRRRGHFCTVVDHVVYDTWNPSGDEFVIAGYWTRPTVDGETTLPIVARQQQQNAEQVLTQKEFDRVLHLLRSLDSTASNSASSEGEKRNALRMMQNLMLRHNLSREDITDDDNIESMRFTRIACPVNGRRACGWEKSLAGYLVKEIFPLTDWYFTTSGPRSLFWFYGPLEDVRLCLSLFRELLLTIATSAQLQYGGYSRGSGASYAEGYVRGLPRSATAVALDSTHLSALVSESALIHARTIAVKQASLDWLKLECGIWLVSGRGHGRDQHDPDAADRGREHGSKHDLSGVQGRKRIAGF